MFKMKCSSKILKDHLTVIANIVDEATFKLTAEGISLRAMDPSRVAMIDWGLSRNAFTEYQCDATETPEKLCVNLTELLKLIKRTGKYKVGKEEQDELVELSKDASTGKLLVAITGKYTRNFTLPTLEPSEEDVPTPKITFNVRAKLVTSQLSTVIEDAQMVSDHVKIEASAEDLVFKAQGDLLGATITVKKDSGVLLDLENKQPPQKATFSLSYLSEIIKTSQATGELATLEYSTDMPLKLDFLQNTENQQLTFFLAPRIETE